MLKFLKKLLSIKSESIDELQLILDELIEKRDVACEIGNLELVKYFDDEINYICIRMDAIEFNVE